MRNKICKKIEASTDGGHLLLSYRWNSMTLVHAETLSISTFETCQARRSRNGARRKKGKNEAQIGDGAVGPLCWLEQQIPLPPSLSERS